MGLRATYTPRAVISNNKKRQTIIRDNTHRYAHKLRLVRRQLLLLTPNLQEEVAEATDHTPVEQKVSLPVPHVTYAFDELQKMFKPAPRTSSVG